jgi:tol-pal system protein YbgF
MQLKYSSLAVALIVMISGCANTDLIMKKQMETDSRLEQLVQGNTAVNAQLAELRKELNDMEARVKSNSSGLEELKPAMGKMRDEVDAIARQKTSEPVSNPVPRIEVVNRDPSPGDREAAAQNAYMKAFGLYSANNYPGAVDAFTAFIKSYPRSEYAGNAMYWIGECHYSQQEFPKAINAFNRVLAEYPKGNKVPDAMLKIGFSYISINDQAKAKVALQNLVNKYPNTPAAVKARERLSHF